MHDLVSVQVWHGSLSVDVCPGLYTVPPYMHNIFMHYYARRSGFPGDADLSPVTTGDCEFVG